MKVFKHTQDLSKEELKEWMQQSKIDSEDSLRNFKEDAWLIALTLLCMNLEETESDPD